MMIALISRKIRGGGLNYETHCRLKTHIQWWVSLIEIYLTSGFMYNDFDHREWWVQVLEVMWMGAGKIITEILMKFLVSDYFIENGKGILIIQSMFFSYCFDTVS